MSFGITVAGPETTEISKMTVSAWEERFVKLRHESLSAKGGSAFETSDMYFNLDLTPLLSFHKGKEFSAPRGGPCFPTYNMMSSHQMPFFCLFSHSTGPLTAPTLASGTFHPARSHRMTRTPSSLALDLSNPTLQYETTAPLAVGFWSNTGRKIKCHALEWLTQGFKTFLGSFGNQTAVPLLHLRDHCNTSIATSDVQRW
ncbi:hypothetical protein B0H19DRAFT_1072536 [Mycena capillaripes]|nr:hypothetical protein B0H19DRAFT_1072536 [Mycena capillaripes]